MGRVPEDTDCRWRHLLVGSGRLAKHLQFYFNEAEIPFQCWSRNGDPQFNSLSPQTYPDSQQRLSETLKNVNCVWLLILDREIQSFVHNHSELRNYQLVHCSGSLVLEEAPSIHPLMTFSSELYSPDFYSKILFVSETGRLGLKDLCPQLDNSSLAINSKLKPLYHALCVASSNFTVLLWQQAQREFEKMGVSWKDLQPYLEQTTHNLIAAPTNALTGPLARGDYQTVSKNLDALADSPLKPVYETFLKLFVDQQTQISPVSKGGHHVHA